MDKKYKIGSIIIMKKQHPCGAMNRLLLELVPILKSNVPIAEEVLCFLSEFNKS